MKCKFALFASLIGLLTVTTSANATVVHWILNDVTISDGQTLTGSFDYDADTSLYSNISVVNSGSSYWSATAFTGTDTPGVDYQAMFYNGTRTAASTRLTLLFPFALTNAGGSIILDTSFPIFTHCNHYDCSSGSWAIGAEIVYITGGQVTSIPEASTWTMLLAGLGLLGISTRYRKPAEVELLT